MAEYVPLGEYVREAYIEAREHDSGVVSGEYGAEYDRWLATHDDAIRTAAWHEGWDAAMCHEMPRTNPHRGTTP